MEGESLSTLDARIEKLWRTLDTRNEGELDLKALKKGLQKMDHRGSNASRACIGGYRLLIGPVALKNADELLKDVLQVVDTSGDERIQYSGSMNTPSHLGQC